MPSKKMGRPTDDPRSYKVSIRLNEKSKKILEAYCEQKSLTKTQAIENGIEKLEGDLKK